MCPLLSNNREKRGLALDGKLKNEDTNLASSTIIRDATEKENLGMVVQYRVKIRLVLGFGVSDVCLELPFTLTHPKPPPEDIAVTVGNGVPTTPGAPSHPADEAAPPNELIPEMTVVADLISLGAGADVASDHSTNMPDDDLIFEDFARLRLKGDEARQHSLSESHDASGVKSDDADDSLPSA